MIVFSVLFFLQLILKYSNKFNWTLEFSGEYDFKKLHKNGLAKYLEYGPLVREEIVPNEPIVWVFKPEDIAEVFKADVGHYPERRSHRALFKFRMDRRDVYNTGGLLPT